MVVLAFNGPRSSHLLPRLNCSTLQDMGYIGDLFPRSPGTHIVGPWVIDSIKLYRELRTGTHYIGNWASRACSYLELIWN